MIDLHADPRARALRVALLRLPLAILLWLVVALIWLLPFLVGLLLIPALIWAGAYEYRHAQPYHRTVLAWRSRWIDWLWGNHEDGIDGLRGHKPHDFLLDPSLPQGWWWLRTKSSGQSMRIFKWSARRNAVNNFRFTELVDFGFRPQDLRWSANCEDASQALIDRRTVEALGQPFRPRLFYLFCWHGPLYAQLWIILTLTRAHHFRWRVGSKACMPRFHAGIPAEHYLQASESFTPLQFSPWRKG